MDEITEDNVQEKINLFQQMQQSNTNFVFDSEEEETCAPQVSAPAAAEVAFDDMD